jgi:hypothetical protein
MSTAIAGEFGLLTTAEGVEDISGSIEFRDI